MGKISEVINNMSPATRQAIEAAAIILGTLLLIWLIARLLRSRRKSPEEIERLRRLELHQHGRITTGQIMDFVESSSGSSGPCLIVYRYDIAGVDYEVAQDISALPTAISLAKQLVGRTTSLKYDTQRPTNSIVACEDWCGLPQTGATAKQDAGGVAPSPGTVKGSPTS